MQGRSAVAILLVILLAACGGGGGSEEAAGGGGGSGGTAASWTQFTGTVLDGGSAQAEPGRRISLMQVDAQGEPVAELASAVADAKGAFTLPLPRGTRPSTDMALVSLDADGTRWRALALHPDVTLGAASEATFRSLLEARTKRNIAFTEDGVRLGRFARNVALMLELVPPPSTALGPEETVARLRRWMAFDPATTSALAQLAANGRLPASIGDVGALLGVARSASRMSADGLATAELRAVTSSDSSGARWSAVIYPPNRGELASLRQELSLADDRVVADSTLTRDSAVNALLLRIGPHAVGTFDLTFGQSHSLTSARFVDQAVQPGGANVEQETQYALSQRTVGIERIDVFGTRLRALRVDTTQTLTITTSYVGTAVVRETLSRWSVPFAGVVRERSIIHVTDVDGTETENESVVVATGAVANDVSWPGAVRVRVEDVALPAHPAAPLELRMVTSDNRLLITGDEVGTDSITRSVFARRLGHPDEDHDLTHVRPLDTTSPLALSTDGSKLYMGLNRFDDDAASGVDKDRAAAAAQGAQVLRFDARTLQQEATLTLPPIASLTQPGRYFPRYLVRHLAVSPTRPLDFAASGVDVVAGSGDRIGERGYGNLDGIWERANFGGGATLVGDQTYLRGWSPDGRRIWMELNGGGPSGLFEVPYDDTGILVDARRARADFPSPRSLGLSDSTAPYDRITEDRVFLDNERIVLDAGTGRVLLDRRQHPDPVLRLATCAARERRWLCNAGETIIELNADDATVLRSWTVQIDLRTLAGAQQLGGGSVVFSPQADTLVYLASGVVAGQDYAVMRVQLD